MHMLRIRGGGRARWAQTFEIVTDEPSLPTQSSMF